jgi:hypothetical protein
MGIDPASWVEQRAHHGCVCECGGPGDVVPAALPKPAGRGCDGETPAEISYQPGRSDGEQMINLLP